MRDLLFVQSTTELGGAETVLLNLLAASEPLRRRSTVVTLGFGRGEMPALLRAVGAEVVELEPARLRRPLAVARSIARIAAVARSRGARLLLGNGAHPQVFAAAAARLAGARSAYLVHMIHRVPVWRNPAIDALATASPFAVALANSAASLEAMRQLRPRARHELLHPGVPLTRVELADVRAARAELGARDGEVLFGVFGRLQGWKGQDVFVEAAARVARESPAARFAVVGGSVFGLEPEYVASLADRARALGLGDRIAFTGQRADVPRLMAACDVVCHTTRVPEPFGMVLVEAMAQGRPVLATRGGGPNEIVEDGETGLLLPPGDAGALADAMGRLAAEPLLRKRFGDAGRTRVEARFEAGRSAERLLAIVERLP
jgi:glycosyltransferase involved in cell wall biosynthesis